MSTINYWDYKQTKISRAIESVENALYSLPTQHIQRGLLITAIGCAIISLIPPLGFWGALSLRSVIVLMAGVQVVHSMKTKEGMPTVLLQIVRLASIALGLSGVALHMNPLIIGSIAGEILYQVGETIRGSHEKDPYKALSHASFVILDAFILTGMLTGAWQYIVTAAAISAFMMFVFAGKTITMGIIRKDPNAVIDSICYIALGCIGITSAVRAAKLYYLVETKSHFFYKNETDHTVTIFDKNGTVIAKVAPGDSVSFNVPAKDHFPGGVELDTGKEGPFLRPQWTDWDWKVLQKPMAPKEFPTAPIGSTFVTEDARVRTRKTEENIPKADLSSFLEKDPGPPMPCFLVFEEHPRFVINHQKSNKKYIFDLAALRKVSGYLDRWVTFQSPDGAKDEYQISFEIEETAFEQLMDFLYRGILPNLDQLTEKTLLDLYDTADYLEIERLRILCQKEIANRLDLFQWENTSLFKPYLTEERSLSPLVKCFNFEKRGFFILI